jgi:hypothetical protein
MWKKTKVMRISRQSALIKIMIYKKQLENVKYFNHFGSRITSDEMLHVKLDPELPWQKQHSTRRRIFSPAH